ncbi:VOC family protein [Streptomyces sp. NBC_00059]|uniref:VOC family protein n=1 Tax=Streptomyces sp. NBC_00059 TaxID=2975635 RepID=UPI0022536EA9|nr:VOC family protein [Streptomyces sp. NBC_00059]MCX5414636.1 VOC family protein [Streptomyces sp. NBC_00059]
MIRWTYTFIDRPAPSAERAASFWSAVTGARPSAPWGERGEFTTLSPDGADACLVTQAVADQGGAHPDLAVEDMAAFTARALRLGATAGRSRPGSTVLRSPGGQPFCVVPWRGQRARPPVLTHSGGTTSRLDQLCLDVAPDAFESEVAFWAELTGWDARPGDHREFHVLRPPLDLPVRLLIQRLDEPRAASAHPDLACSDLTAGRSLHERFGAEFLRDGDGWTVMRDPAGGIYCLTGRDPATGE